MATKANLALYQGDDFSAVVTVTNGQAPADVLTGYTAQAQIRKTFADLATDVECEITTSIDSPYIYLQIPHDVTAKLAGNYLWDLQIADAGGLITTLLAGAVTVSLEVTRE